MDFVTYLFRFSRGCDAVWVVVDRLSKSVYFIFYGMIFSLKKMAKLYVDFVVRLYGVSVLIVSDRDSRFIFRFWKSLQTVLGIRLVMSIAYYFQTDG